MCLDDLVIPLNKEKLKKKKKYYLFARKRNTLENNLLWHGGIFSQLSLKMVKIKTSNCISLGLIKRVGQKFVMAKLHRALKL